MIQLTSRERGIFVLFLTVCCIYAGYIFIYRPAVVERQRIVDDLRLARKRLSEQLKVIQKDRQIPEYFRESLKVKIQADAPQEAMSAILSRIETASRGMMVRITEMKPQGVIKEEEINKYPVSLTVDGNFQELMAFIHLLQSPEHDLNVTQFHLEKGFADSKSLIAKIVVVRLVIRPQVDPGQSADRNVSKLKEYEPT